MSGLLTAVASAQKLTEIHEVISRLYGDKFQSPVTEYESFLRKIAEPDGNLIGAATKLCQKAEDPREQLLVLAVAVELTKRDKQISS